ncbi:MAG: hypothetical protein LBH17_05355, partial [Oscillospiraceae bacterium]|nr:hypothetical protein [Oscillospiraceae bacterium]
MPAVTALLSACAFSGGLPTAPTGHCAFSQIARGGSRTEGNPPCKHSVTVNMHIFTAKNPQKFVCEKNRGFSKFCLQIENSCGKLRF